MSDYKGYQQWGDEYVPVQWVDGDADTLDQKQPLNAENLSRSEEYLQKFSKSVFDVVNTSVDKFEASVNNLNTSVNNLNTSVDGLREDYYNIEKYAVQNINGINYSLNNKIESATIHLTDEDNPKQGVTKDGMSLKIVVDAYDKKYVDNISGSLQELSNNVYTKEEVNTIIREEYMSTIDPIEAKVYSHEQSIKDLQDQAKDQSNTITGINNSKADKATTLGGYGIKDAYTKEEVDTIIANSGGSGGTIPDFTQTNYLILKCV